MILVTGGCGYIGAHLIVNLLENKTDVISLDNFSNSSHKVVDNIKHLTSSSLKFIKGDVRDDKLLDRIFSENRIRAVVHFAGRKSITESFINPLDYYSSNVSGSISLIKAMDKAKVSKLIFSSSATVYGNQHPLPWHEKLELSMPSNPYAQSKLIVEEILKSLHLANSKWSIGILRYFNPIGSHKSGLIGDNIDGKNLNLIPSIIKVFLGKSPYLHIFGNDFDTPDGTGVRDYIHIDDLLEGHIKALHHIDRNRGINIWNLGAGKGHSVLEILKIFEDFTGKEIPYEIKNRRKGDLSKYWADVSKAKKELGWFSKYSVEEMIRDSLNYIQSEE